MVKKTKRRHRNPGDIVLGGRYEILKVIHTSGMSNVYMVADKSLGKNWCLKEIIKSEAGKNKVEYRSLIQEANIMKSLSHSGIPRIVTMEEDGDSVFIIMDYVDGLSIKNWIQRKGRIKEDVAVNWMKQICSVMIYLHNRKKPIFYRDMKPDNVMIQSDGNIKVVDFGISVVITEDNKLIKEALGTRGYAAPEQKKRGLPYDLRSDIYAMGKTLYYMLTGVNPGLVEDNLKGIREIDSSLSMGLDTIIKKCIEEDVEKRYQSVEELLYDLQNYDKLDIIYRKKARRKINIVMGMFISSIFILFMSFIPLLLNRAEKEDKYQNLLLIASQSGRVEDYENAIEYRPEELSPYLDYINLLKVDGVFSKEEEEKLLSFLNPILITIKENKLYGELSYEIGKLYWFYYDSTLDDNMVLSVRWFSDAVDKGYKKEEANVYYQMGMFKKDIAMAIAESSDAGLYGDYWRNLLKAKEISSGEVVGLQLNTIIAETISSYSYRLRTDKVSKEEVLAEVKSLEDFLSESQPSVGKAEELYENLKNIVSTLREKVNVAYEGES